MFKFKGAYLLLILIGVSFCPQDVEAQAAEKDLTLTSSEKIALDKFKHAMEPFLTEDRLKQEVYLIRWLRVAHFDLQRAEQMLLDDIDWRITQKMDKIHTENWSDFQRNYEYRVDGVDKFGQPLVTTDMGNWDFRQAMLAGKRDKMLRYIYKMLEEMEVAVKKQQDKGILVTRGNIILDMANYNVVTHACMQCVSMYFELIRAFDTHYPGIYEKIIMVNTPAAFEALLSILRPVMTKETRDSLQVFGSNKREWQKYLREFIDDEELSFEYGGSRIPS